MQCTASSPPSRRGRWPCLTKSPVESRYLGFDSAPLSCLCLCNSTDFLLSLSLTFHCWLQASFFAVSISTSKHHKLLLFTATKCHRKRGLFANYFQVVALLGACMGIDLLTFTPTEISLFPLFLLLRSPASACSLFLSNNSKFSIPMKKKKRIKILCLFFSCSFTC